MRTIKFRYWDMVRKEFITDGDVYFVAEDAIFAGDFNNPPLVDITGHVQISQFTGLHDKNGKEIYEGDIVKGKAYEFNGCPRIIGEVVYDYCEFKVKSVRDKTSKMKAELNTTYEVIGNIYENANLLEQTS